MAALQHHSIRVLSWLGKVAELYLRPGLAVTVDFLHFLLIFFKSLIKSRYIHVFSKSISLGENG